MADFCDAAASLEDQQRRWVLESRPKAAPGGGLTTCLDCGTAIAPERLAAVPGARRCADCQTDLERRPRR